MATAQWGYDEYGFPNPDPNYKPPSQFTKTGGATSGGLSGLTSGTSTWTAPPINTYIPKPTPDRPSTEPKYWDDNGFPSHVPYDNTGQGLPAGQGNAAPAPTIPTPTGVNTFAPGVLTTPGAYEQWYDKNKGNFTDRYSYGQAYYDNLKQQYGPNGIQPTNTQNANSVIAQRFMQPSQGSEAARSLAGQLGEWSDGEHYINQAAGYFQGPNMTSTYAQGLDPRAFNTSGASENFYNYAAPQLAGRGAGEQNVYGMMPQFQQRGAAEVNNDIALSQLLRNNSTRDVYNQMMGSGFLDRNIAGDEFDFFRPELRQTSDSENLYASGNQGLNTFYDREYDKRSRRLQDQMAAMGVFGSGAMGRGLYELEGELGAAQARDMAALAAQSDQARLARINQAQSFSQAAGGEEMARYGQGIEAGRSVDDSTRGNVAAMTDAASIAQQMQLDRLFKSGTLGLDADQAGRERLQLSGDLARQSDEALMNRLSTGADIYRSADDSMVNQGRALADAGNMMSTQSLNRLKEAGDLGFRADQEDRTRLNDMFAAARDTDAGIRDFETFNRQTARDLDTDYLDALTRGGEAADRAQTRFETRERYPIQDQLGLSKAQADLAQSARGASADEQKKIADDLVQTLIADGRLTQQEAQQKVDDIFKLLGVGVQFAKL